MERKDRYSLSPYLFTLLRADMNDELGRRCWGRMKVESRKMYSLAYADDVAKNEDKMREIMNRMERYLDGKGLEINIGKTKI